MKIKRVIDGKTYNTETSKRIATEEAEQHYSEREYERGIKTTRQLFMNRHGAFFVVRVRESEQCDPSHLSCGQEEWQFHTSYELYPLSQEAAQMFVMQNRFGVSVYDDSVFGNAPEAGEEVKEETVLIRMSSILKAKLTEAAKAEEKSLNAYMISCSERCLKFAA